MSKLIQLGKQYHRSLTEASVVCLNTETLQLEIKVVPVNPELVSVLRGRIRHLKTPNLTMETMVVMRSEDGEISSAYRVTTNRYGMTVVPWSLVNREDLRKDGEILGFRTTKENKILSISREGNMVSTCYQDLQDGAYIVDRTIDYDENRNLSAAIVGKTFYLAVAEDRFDVVISFPDIEDINPEDILEQFTEDRTFTV